MPRSFRKEISLDRPQGATASGRRVLLVDLELGGHHGAYLTWMARSLIRHGIPVEITVSAQSLKTPAGQHLQQRLNSMAAILGVPAIPAQNGHSAVSALRHQFAIWNAYRRLFQEAFARGELAGVIVPYINSTLYAMVLRGSPFADRPWVGVDMRAAFHFKHVGVHGRGGRFGALQQLVYGRLLSDDSLRCLFTIDPTLQRYARQLPASPWRKVDYLPDPVEVCDRPDRTVCRKQLNLPSDCFLVVLYGSIEVRKGLDALVAGLAHPKCPARVCALIAGQYEADVRPWLNRKDALALQRTGRLYMLDSFLTSEEEKCVLGTADALWLGYKNHLLMSSVLAQAGWLGIPVLACKEGVIGKLTTVYQSGITVDVHHPASVAEALGFLSEASEACLRMASNASKAYRAHRVEDVENYFAPKIRECFPMAGENP